MKNKFWLFMGSKCLSRSVIFFSTNCRGDCKLELLELGLNDWASCSDLILFKIISTIFKFSLLFLHVKWSGDVWDDDVWDGGRKRSFSTFVKSINVDTIISEPSLHAKSKGVRPLLSSSYFFWGILKYLYKYYYQYFSLI